ncbi:hypothetical protein BDW02DRAFT_160708 [Decorospora gaudefroyi]|uniref:Uncharacterized protein n=1 Tax=Decorospora gaudefroyi TaxID=184978 RepID=A0A6A5KPS8_9PLEO|nr:hypothetical protein BDW02DRAFT_160708 [Decorospora gaudefroyi]
MADLKKGKEKATATVNEAATARSAADASTFDSGTVEDWPVPAVATPPPAEAPAASTGPVDAPSSTTQAELPWEPTEGPSALAEQINPHVSVVSHASILAFARNARSESHGLPSIFRCPIAYQHGLI